MVPDRPPTGRAERPGTGAGHPCGLRWVGATVAATPGPRPATASTAAPRPRAIVGGHAGCDRRPGRRPVPARWSGCLFERAAVPGNACGWSRWPSPGRWAGPARRNRLSTTDTRERDWPPNGDTISDMARATVVLLATPPFRLDLTVWALRRRQKNTVDRWDDGQYSRVIVADGDPVQLTVTQDTAEEEPVLIVTVESTTRISARARKEAGL